MPVTIRVERHLVVIELEQILGVVKQGSFEPFERYVVDRFRFFIQDLHSARSIIQEAKISGKQASSYLFIRLRVNDLRVVPEFFPELEMVLDRPVVQIGIRLLKVR